MKKYFLLTKILLKSGLGDFSNKKSKRKFSLSKISSKLLYVFIIICFFPLMTSLFFAGKEGYNLLNGIGQSGIVINLICSASSIMTLIFGMVMVITVYYFASDIENLLPLPLTSNQIIASKFTITLFYEYITVVILCLPPLVGYGVAGSLGILYWVMVVFTVLLLPIVPLIYASVISMIIMLLFKKAKNKDFLTIVSSMLAIIVVLGINGLSSSFVNMSPEAISQLLVQGNNSLVGTINVVFPNLSYLEKALVFQQPWYLGYYILTIILFIVVFLFIANLIYFRGVGGVSQTASRRKVLSEDESNKLIRKNNVIKMYIIKELKLLVRTPIYFLNCVLITMIWPILFVIPFIGSILSNKENNAPGFDQMFGELSLGNALISGICLLIVFGITIFVSSINFTTGTSLSREGKNFFVIKYIPLSYKKQLFAKAMSGIILNLISTTLYCLIAMLFLGMPLFAIVVSTIVSFISCFIFNYLSLIVDLIRPKLNWENEQSAVKQNMNTVFEMFISIVIGGIFVVLGIVAYITFHLSIYVIGIIACLLLLILAILLHKLVMSFGAKRIKSIE